MPRWCCHLIFYILNTLPGVSNVLRMKNSYMVCVCCVLKHINIYRHSMPHTHCAWSRYAEGAGGDGDCIRPNNVCHNFGVNIGHLCSLCNVYLFHFHFAFVTFVRPKTVSGGIVRLSQYVRHAYARHERLSSPKPFAIDHIEQTRVNRWVPFITPSAIPTFETKFNLFFSFGFVRSFFRSLEAIKVGPWGIRTTQNESIKYK